MRRYLYCACLIAGLFVTSCNTEIERFRIKLELTVEYPQKNTTGTLYVSFHHRSSGKGVLEYPLQEIETVKRKAAVTQTLTLDYPLAGGTGLVVYGWLDVNGDGILCAPDKRGEPTGIVELKEELQHRMKATLSLKNPDRQCLGPEAQYP